MKKIEKYYENCKSCKWCEITKVKYKSEFLRCLHPHQKEIGFGAFRGCEFVRNKDLYGGDCSGPGGLYWEAKD